METVKADLEQLNKIISSYQGQRWALIPLLHEIQRAHNYIPPEIIPRIASAVGVFPSQVQAVISFYTQLHTVPRGKNIVRVCRGTACHVRGGKTILKLVKQQLGVDEGESTPDMGYTLETVACIGCCALAPNMVINSNIYGHMNPRKVVQVLGSFGGR